MPAGRFSPLIFPGAVFGKLTVVKRIPRKENGRSKVLCRCECGKESVTEGNSLTSGRVHSCGCQQYDGLRSFNREKVGTGDYGKVQPGVVFGRLTVIERVWKKDHPTTKVKCRCNCGKVATVGIDALLCGGTKSCGCLNQELRIKRNRENARFKGFSRQFPQTFQTWRSMKNRTFHPSEPESKGNTYGIKTVQACKHLWESPLHLQSLIGDRPTKRHTLDRYPVHNGVYSCGQCEECCEKGWSLNIRWATRKQQAENRGHFNVPLTAFGKTMLLSQWQQASGIDARRIMARIKRDKWSVEKAIATPDSKGHCYKPLECL